MYLLLLKFGIHIMFAVFFQLLFVIANRKTIDISHLKPVFSSLGIFVLLSVANFLIDLFLKLIWIKSYRLRWQNNKRLTKMKNKSYIIYSILFIRPRIEIEQFCKQTTSPFRLSSCNSLKKKLTTKREIPYIWDKTPLILLAIKLSTAKANH